MLWGMGEDGGWFVIFSRRDLGSYHPICLPLLGCMGWVFLVILVTPFLLVTFHTPKPKPAQPPAQEKAVQPAPRDAWR